MDEYTKTAWAADDVITATKLNHIEDGIEAVTDEVEAIEEHFDPTKGMLFVRANTIQPTIGDGILGCFVYTSSASHNGYSYKTEIEKGGGKIVFGIAKTNKANSYQLVFGQVNILSNNFVSVFPWVSDYIDENYVIQATAEGKTTVLVGSNVSTGTTDFTMGSTNVTTGSICMNFGQYNHVTQNLASTIGEGLLAGYRTQFCVGCANDNKEEDAFEIGNGTYDISAGTISRSNAFRVTKTGSAIAQTSLGIEDGNGGVVSITAAQLQALLSNASPTCLVTMTYDSTNNRYVSDKTAAEVYAAYNAAKSVVFKFSDIGYVMWGGRDHAEAFCPNVHMLYRESAAGDISDPKYIIDGYGPNDITLGMVAPTSADYFIMEIS